MGGGQLGGECQSREMKRVDGRKIGVGICADDHMTDEAI